MSTLADYFNSLPICPACYAARELTQIGLCHTCTRLWNAGMLREYRERLKRAGLTKPGSVPPEDDAEPIHYQEPIQQEGQPMFEPLFKRTSTGAVQIWQIRVEPQDDGTAIIVTTHGQVDGKQQEGRDTVREGKNPGKKNATTPYEQAIKEAESKWNEKLERERYGFTVEESDIKRMFAPMLAQSWTDKKGQLTSYAKKVNWEDKAHLHVQPKFDGHRCLIINNEQGLRLFTRKGVQVTTCEHLVDQLKSIMPANTAFDGELYTHGVPVTTIGGYITKKQEGTENLCLMLYDCFAPMPFLDRLNHVSSLLAGKNATHLHLARTQPIADQDQMLDFQGQCIENGYEGAMLRHGTTGYENGDRSASLLKVKTFVDEEFVVVGCKEGRGKFEGAAVFECVTSAGHKFDCTAPGDMPTKQAYWRDHQQYIGKRLTVKFQKYTETAEPVPFQPVAKGFV